MLTRDQETGGLVTARQVSPNYPDYLWYPQVLLNSTHFGEYLARKLILEKSRVEKTEAVKSNEVNGNGEEADKVEKEKKEKALELFIIKEIIEKDMGIADYTAEEVDAIKASLGNGEQLLYVLNNMILVRSQTGWTTHGHSAVDVNIYGYTNSKVLAAELYQSHPYTGLLGNHENIEIGAFMAKITGADLDLVTEKIKGIKHSPLAAVHAEEHEHLLDNLRVV